MSSKNTQNSNNKNYSKKVEAATPNSPIVKNCLKAFFSGGLICVFGEALNVLFIHLGADKKDAATCVSIVLIVLTAILTGIGVFDKIAKHTGAGTAVPITGFANSVAAPAIEYITEGHVPGTAVKMFSLAGPVIVYGCSAASIYGFIYYFFCLGGAV